jgi:hypothetical protein
VVPGFFDDQLEKLASQPNKEASQLDQRSFRADRGVDRPVKALVGLSRAVVSYTNASASRSRDSHRLTEELHRLIAGLTWRTDPLVTLSPGLDSPSPAFMSLPRGRNGLTSALIKLIARPVRLTVIFHGLSVERPACRTSSSP